MGGVGLRGVVAVMEPWCTGTNYTTSLNVNMNSKTDGPTTRFHYQVLCVKAEDRLEINREENQLCFGSCIFCL